MVGDVGTDTKALGSAMAALVQGDWVPTTNRRGLPRDKGEELRVLAILRV